MVRGEFLTKPIAASEHWWLMTLSQDFGAVSDSRYSADGSEIVCWGTHRRPRGLCTYPSVGGLNGVATGRARLRRRCCIWAWAPVGPSGRTPTACGMISASTGLCLLTAICWPSTFRTECFFGFCFGLRRPEGVGGRIWLIEGG